MAGRRTTTPRASSPSVPRSALRAPHLPEAAGPWFNGGPSAGWRGAVTLVDFWTYSCVNCLRTLPALRAWHARYRDAGLTVLGVHTPEFPFEREPANVARALRELAVAYPVVLDNDRAIWERFANRHWPHRYLIDRRGRIRHDHLGEGGEAATERAIRAVLAEADPATRLPEPVYAAALDDADETEAPAGAFCVPATPELFAGYYRGICGNPGGFREDRAAFYRDAAGADGYREGYIHLQGRWRVDTDAAHFLGPEPGYLRVAYRGAAVNAVLAPAADGAPVTVTAGCTIVGSPGQAAPDGVGGPAARLTVDAARLYPLPVGPAPAGALNLLTLTPDAPGLAVYSFTFGGCPPE